METNHDLPQKQPLNVPLVSKSVFNYEIEKLNSGFLITKNETQRVGISTIENLENAVQKILSDNTDLKENLYFKGNSKVKITISVEVVP